MSGSHDRPEFPAFSASAEHTPTAPDSQATTPRAAWSRDSGGRQDARRVRLCDREKAGRYIDF
jgi:hypothetical protein